MKERITILNEIKQMVKGNAVLNLIGEISNILEKYDKQDEAVGSNYNIFNVLNISRREFVHSNMLGNLLDKNGEHGYSSIFLEAFIQLLRSKFQDCDHVIKILDNLEVPTCKVYQEYRLGSIKGKNGGIIDILIKDRFSNAVIIENKIDAVDQLHQLIRYCNSHKNALIIYLTLNGDEPSNESCGILENNTDYVCLSYKTDILKWLNDCQAKVFTKTNLRNTLTQYIYIIKELTNQSTNEDMENDLISSIIKNKESIRSAFQITYSIDKVKVWIVKTLLDNTLLKLGSDWSMTPWDYFEVKETQEIWLHYKDWETHAVVLSFEEYFDQLDIGIYRKDNEESKDVKLRTTVGKALSHFHLGEIYGYSNWIWLTKYEKWNLIEWEDLIDELKLEEDLNYLTSVLIDVQL